MRTTGTGRINLAEELRGIWDHAIITTFSTDLGFFERAILPMLSGTRGRLLLVDSDHLLGFQASAARERLVRSLNRGYLASAIATPAAAHAKVVLLLGPDKGRLLVGSGNLGLKGWASVGELFSRYDFAEEEPSYLPAFVAARSMLDGLAKAHYLDDFAAAYLEEIWTTVPWLQGEPTPGLLRHSLFTPLLDQLVAEIRDRGHPVEELVVMAPFHDARCNALEALLAEFQPARAQLLVQPGQTSVNPVVLDRLRKRHANLSVCPFEPKGHSGSTYVHAKLILARTAEQAFCFQGSANLSTPALLQTLPKGNLEANNLLVGARDEFDSLLKELKIGKPVRSLRELALELRSEPPPDAGGAPGIRLLEARWEGAALRIRVAGKWRAHAGQELLVVVGTEPVRCRVLDASDDPFRKGQSTARLQVPDESVPLFDRTVSIWLFPADSIPKYIDEADLSNPVYCVNQPALTAQLRGSAAGNRIRDLGWLSLAEDRELEDLLRALQGTMIFDQRTLIETRPPERAVAEDANDAELLVAYSSIDYAALRANPRFRQYEAAIGNQAANAAQIASSDIQLALRSITDAFNGIVGRPRASRRAVELTAEWAVHSNGPDEDNDEASRGEVVASASEEELEADPTLQEESARRWSQDARLRTHWRNFIQRFLQGMSSQAWRELVGPSVIAGNYLIFSHIMQRLHRQSWTDFSFLDFLLASQANTHGFVWGVEGSSAWIDELGETERSYILSAFADQHLGVRLVVDLAAAGSLTRPEEFDQWEQLIEERKTFRDAGRAAFSHPAWKALAATEPSLIEDAAAIAADLSGAWELACWTEPPSREQLLEDVTELLDFASDKEILAAVARELGLPRSRLELASVTLGHARLSLVAEEIRGQADGSLDEETARRAMAVWSRLSSAAVLRLAIGRSRLLFERAAGRLLWMPSLSADERELPGPEESEMPWDEALALLGAASWRQRTKAKM
jgi:hypothetical protein